VQAVHAIGADILHIQDAAGTYGFERAIFLPAAASESDRWRGKIVITVHEYGWWSGYLGIPPQVVEWLKMGAASGWWDLVGLLTQSDAVIHKRLPVTNRVSGIAIAANVEFAPIDRTTARQMLRESCTWPKDAIVLVFGLQSRVGNLLPRLNKCR